MQFFAHALIDLQAPSFFMIPMGTKPLDISSSFNLETNTWTKRCQWTNLQVKLNLHISPYILSLITKTTHGGMHALSEAFQRRIFLFSAMEPLQSEKLMCK